VLDTKQLYVISCNGDTVFLAKSYDCTTVGLILLFRAFVFCHYVHYLIMAALHSRCEHYILQLWFLLFFLRLFLVVTYWMSTIFPHMMWPQCEFRMRVWNVLHAARWKYRMQKLCKNRHLCTIAQIVRLYLRN